MQILGLIGGPEILAVALLVLLLFGGQKIPELMKGLGKGVNEYKKAVGEIEKEVHNITSDIDSSNHSDSSSTS